MYTSDRSALRRVYVESWQRHCAGLPLEPLQQQVAEVITLHPEYHALLAAGEAALQRDWHPQQGEGNPFLHLSLHLAIREQLAVNRPFGIHALYRRMVLRWGGEHPAEHQMIECLEQVLWEAQQQGQAANEEHYLKCLRGRLG